MGEITVIFRIEVDDVPEPTGGVIDLQGPLLSANIKTPMWEREITIKEGYPFAYEISFRGPGVVYKDPRVRPEGDG